MVRFCGTKLRPEDMWMMKKLAKFTMNKFITPSVQKKLSVKIRFVESIDNWSGECYYLGCVDGIRRFEINISLKRMRKNGKNVLTRLLDPMKTLIHELIHVKQYANNQMFDYTNGNTKFEGKVYRREFSYNQYWDCPWEIEAYGRTDGVFEMFLSNIKKEAKEKGYV